MRLSFAEVFETATFYAHFDVVKEGEPDIAPLTIRVCDSLTCAMLGAEKLLAELQNSAGPGVRVVRAPCVGLCDSGAGRPRSAITSSINADAAERARRRGARRDPSRSFPTYVDYDAYVQDGGYKLLERPARRRASARKTCSRSLDDAGLRGLGGAGFPDGAQMARGARRARPAPDGGQWRRGRARHLQGPLLSRDAIRTASSRAC